jgi:putative addiction module component (TIGR02574 family)
MAHSRIGGKRVNPSTVFEAALGLGETDRIQLVERLLETLGPETDGVDEATFVAELRRRSDEIDQGKAEFLPWSELRNEPF